MNKDRVRNILQKMSVKQLVEVEKTPQLPCYLKDLLPNSVDILPSQKVVSLIPFQTNDAAVKFLKTRGYVVGVLQGYSPIGFVKKSLGFNHIEKWRNIGREELDILNGIIYYPTPPNSSVVAAFFAED